MGCRPSYKQPSRDREQPAPCLRKNEHQVPSSQVNPQTEVRVPRLCWDPLPRPTATQGAVHERTQCGHGAAPDAPSELTHRPLLGCLLPFPIHSAYRCLNSFILCAIPLKAAFHDISVTNSYSDELDSISYLQLLTRFYTGISARNLHTVSERMMSCSDKTLTLK